MPSGLGPPHIHNVPNSRLLFPTQERDVQGICGPEVNLRLDGMLSPTEPVMSDEEKLKRRYGRGFVVDPYSVDFENKT